MHMTIAIISIPVGMGIEAMLMWVDFINMSVCAAKVLIFLFDAK